MYSVHIDDCLLPSGILIKMLCRRNVCLGLLFVLQLPQAIYSTTVYKCGTKNKEIINSVTATLGNCTTSRCSLKKNSTMHIEIKFKPVTIKTIANCKDLVIYDIENESNDIFTDFNVLELITEVYGVVLNIPIPLLGVDNKSVCHNIFEENGTKKNCPLPKGGTYIYKDDIYIIEAYPKFKVDVHWSLKDPISRKFVACFEAPAKIID